MSLNQIDRRVFLAAAGVSAAIPFTACAQDAEDGFGVQPPAMGSSFMEP